MCFEHEPNFEEYLRTAAFAVFTLLNTTLEDDFTSIVFPFEKSKEATPS